MSLLTTLISPGVSAPAVFGGYFWHDFRTGLLPTGYTYACTSVVRRWSPTGGQYIEVPANTYVPDYDPLTGANLGYLSEATATNLCLYSSDISNAAWIVVAATKGASAGSLIAGGTAQSITTSSTNALVRQTVGTFTGASETFYAIVEQGAGSLMTSVSARDQTAAINVGTASLTWSTGAVVASFGGTAYAKKLLDAGPNGGLVYLIAVTFTGTLGNSRDVRVLPYTSGSGTTVYVHHAQLVTGTRVTPPIVTAGSTVNRAATILSLATLPSWFDQSKYTMFAEVSVRQAFDADSRILALNDGGSSNRDMLYAIGSSYFSRLVTSGGATQAATNVLGNATGVTRVASSLAANQARHAVKGTAAAEDTVVTMPTVSAVHIGHYGSALQPNAHILRVGIAPVTQTTAQLQALTA